MLLLIRTINFPIMQKQLVSLCGCFLFCTSLLAQLSGVITDDLNNPLPYATIYLQGSSTGTSSNIEGEYVFNLPNGTHSVVFQYVGFETQIIEIEIEGDELIKNVTLSPSQVNLEEVVIAADAEDPAYGIIRKAIEKREYYKNKINTFKAKIYIKGLIGADYIPESFLGQDLGTLEGILDSTRQGVLYFSESESDIFFKAPNTYREVMHASKVSGESNGVSFNNFTDSHFNFYEEHLEFNRDFLSPIADRALSYYKYKLLGTTYDKDGRTINKIEVIPKSNNDPVFFGTIYITDDLWNIHSVDLALEGRAAKDNIIDTLNIKQIFVPLGEEDNWVMFSQVLNMTMGIFSVKLNGSFSFVFRDYELNIDLPDNTFTREIIKINEDAHKNDIAYWDAVRPIPLTEKEKLDYQKKDSLEVLWNTESYRDSIDRIDNKFTPLNLIFGYQYLKSFKNERYYFNSPLSTIQFSAVEGYKLALNLGYSKSDKDFTKFLYINPQVSYAFAEKKWRGNINLRRKSNSINNQRFAFSIGRKILQFNENNPISRFTNTLESLISKENYIRLYEKDVIDFSYRRDLQAGLRLGGKIEISKRRALTLHSDHSWFEKDKVYANNNLFNQTNSGVAFEDHRHNSIQLELKWTPNLKYITAGKRRIDYGSSFPTLTVDYRKGLAIAGGETDFDKIRINILDRKVNLNIWGFFGYSLEFGKFLNNKNVYTIDLFHFNGNQSYATDRIDHLGGFKRLRFYDLSRDADYYKYHLEYHAAGRILDKIPVIRNTNMQMVFSHSGIFQKGVESFRDAYREASIGIEGIGFGGLSLFRLDYTLSYPGDFSDHGFTLSTQQQF